VNVYGKRVVEALDKPRTVEELAQVTGFDIRFVFAGINDARASGYMIAADPNPGEATMFRLEDRDDRP
jgi:hypothetical protein